MDLLGAISAATAEIYLCHTMVGFTDTIRDVFPPNSVRLTLSTVYMFNLYCILLQFGVNCGGGEQPPPFTPVIDIDT